MNENLKYDEMSALALENTVVEEEEFFEGFLFQDILEMKSLKKVSETTAIDLNHLQDRVYQSLYNLYQEVRGIPVNDTPEKDEIFTIFELFLKNYYQHFRNAMENLISAKSPVKVAYVLGKNSDTMIAMLDQFVNSIEQEIH